MTNLTFGWGKKQWVVMLIGFLPMVFVYFWILSPGGDFTKELQVTLTETRVSENRIDVFGKLENVGNHTWERITVEAEFFDQSGQFLDEASEYMSVSLLPESEENFRLTLSNPADRITKGDPNVVLKVAGADVNRF